MNDFSTLFSAFLVYLLVILGANFLYVSIHEFGHALGLRHSDVTGAVMEPVVKPYDPNQQLHEDDILGIQELYGRLYTGIMLKRPIPVVMLYSAAICY